MAQYVFRKNIWNFDPTSIAGCTLWLDGADANTMFSNAGGTVNTTAGGNVLVWKDKSVSGNNAQSAITTTRANTGATSTANFPTSTATTISYCFPVSNNTTSWGQGVTTGNTMTVTGVTPSTFNVSNATISSVQAMFSVTVNGNGTTATYTVTPSTLGLLVGSTVVVFGFGTAAFNGTFTMGSQTATTFTVANATNSGGTLTGGTIYSMSGSYLVTVNSTAVGVVSTATAMAAGNYVVTNTQYPTMGSNAVAFNGNQYFSLNASLFPTGSSNATYFFVSTVTSGSTRQGLFHHGGNQASSRSLAVGQTANTYYFGPGNTSGNYPTSGTLTMTNNNLISFNIDNQIGSAWSNGTPFTLRQNQDQQPLIPSGGLNTPTNNAVIGMAFFYLAQTSNAPGHVFPLTGSISEILVFNSTLSNTDRQTIEGYLAYKWGISAKLLRTHPYAPVVSSLNSIRPSNYSGLALWLDAADRTTITFSSGSNVSAWNDKSGNGNNFSVASGAPRFNSTENAISFVSTNSASNDTMISASSITFTTNVTSMFFVANIPTNPFNNFQYIWNIGNGTDYAWRTNFTTPPVMYPNQSPIGTDSTFYYIGTPVINTRNNTPTYPATGVFMIDGVYSGGSGTITTRTTLSSAANIGGGFRGLTGLIYEVLVFNTALTTTQRQEIEGYLAWKWGVHASLPTGHPYSTELVVANPVIRPFSRNFVPTDIDGCQFWIDPADRTTVTLTGSNVTAIRDKSGQGNSVANAGSTLTYATTMNGLPTIVGPTGTANNTITTTNTAIVRDTVNHSEFYVYRYSSTPSSATQSIGPQRVLFSGGQFLGMSQGTGTAITLVASSTTSPSTITLSTPANTNNLVVNQPVQFTSTFGGITSGTTYFIFSKTSNAITISTTSFGVQYTGVTTSATGGSGTATTFSPYFEENNNIGAGGNVPISGNLSGTLNVSSYDIALLGNTYVVGLVRQNGVYTLTVNGFVLATNTNQPNSNLSPISYQIQVGNQGANIGDVIIYNAALNVTERQQVEGYLLWKWGLRGGNTTTNASVPTTHPFYKFPPPSSTPFQPEVQLYRKRFDPSDLSPTVWLDSADTTTYASTNNRLTSWTSKGTQALTFAPPNIPYAVQILSSTTIPTGGTGTTFTMSRTVGGIGTLSGVTVTVGGVAITGCTLIGGSNQLTTGSSVTIANGASVTALTYSITLQSSTTTTGGTGTSFTLNLAPTGTGTISGVQAYVAGVPIPNCTFTGGSTTFTTGASTTIANGADVVVQPGPLINSATRGSGFNKTYTDFTSGGTFRLTAGTNAAYNSTAITLTASTVALDGQSIVISSVPRVTLVVNQPIVFSGSGTVIAGTTNITAGTTYFIRNVSTLAASNTNFPTNYITLSLSSGGAVITGLTPNTSLSATATAGAYLFTFTTSIPHRIPNGAPITAVLDGHKANGSVILIGTFFGNIQSVPTTTSFTFWLTSNLTNIAAGTSTDLIGSIQYGNNTVVSASLAGDGTTLTMTTALPHNLQTGFVIQPYFFGPSLPSQWGPYTAATVRSGTSTFTGTISGTTLTVSAGTPPGIGAVLTGIGVTANTYVRGILTYGTSYEVSVSSSVTGITITSTYTGPITFTGSIAGTTLTYTSGTVPLLGMIISGSTTTSGTYIVSGTSPTFTVSVSSTVTSTTLAASNYSVELTFPSTNWPILTPGLNNNGSTSITSSTGNNITISNSGAIGPVGGIIVFISAVGAVPAGAYYVASLSGQIITISSSRTLSPVLTPGTSSTTVPAWIYRNDSLFRLCSFGTSPLNNLTNLNGSMVWFDNASRIISLSGFTGTQPSAGVMTMSQIQNPGLQYGGSGSFSNQYLWGAHRITLVDANSFTISLNNLNIDAITLSGNASQTYGGITYSGPMANYGFTDFRFGGNVTGQFSFGNTTNNTVTQAMISYPANGYLLDASGSNLTNSFNSQTTTVLMAVHSSTVPLRAGGFSFASTLLSTAVTSNNIGGRDTTSGGRDFSLIPSGTSQGLQMMLGHNNSTASFRPPATVDTASGYRIFSIVFNGTGSAVGDVAALTRNMAAFGWRYDAVNGTFAYNTSFFPGSATTITSGTALAPTVMRLGGDTAIYGFGINSISFGDMGIAELLVFNTPLTREQRQLAEGYLSQKYCCQPLLANGSTSVSTTAFIHPYRLNPTSISASVDLTQLYTQGLAAWFNATNSSTITFASSNNVNSWTSSGGNFTLTLVPNSTNYPTLVQDAQNGLPGVRFAISGTPLGTSFIYPITNFSTLNTNNEFTIITVYKQPTFTSSQVISNIIGSANNPRLMAQTDSFSYRNTTTEQTKVYTANVSGQTYVSVYYRRGVTLFVRDNGSTDAGSTTSGTNLNIPSSIGSIFGVTLGAYAVSSPTTSPFAGDIYEHMIFRYALTDQAIFQIEGYLAWKWGLQRSLPTTHPYYNVRP